ncbi:MAG: enoyl-CoA hydratase/isomerase family protein, partial [Spirochaetota bacterium]
MATGKINITDKEQTVIAELDLNEKNVINANFVGQMNEIMDRYENNKTIRTLIVTATGNFFSNGFDPEQILGVEGSVVEKNVGEAFLLLKRFYRLPFITIAAINGHCMGYGAVWSLFFDFRFMVDSKARFGYPEALIGLALPKSTSLLLKELIGVRAARDLAIFGTGLKPATAKEIGLIDDIFSKEELLTKVEKFAAKF